MTEIYMPKFDLEADSAFSSLVNALTNKERNQWARAGYPGLRKKEAAPVAEMFPQTVRRRVGWVSSLSSAASDMKKICAPVPA